jgi:hypothetical protein
MRAAAQGDAGRATVADAETLRTEIPARMQAARRWLVWRLGPPRGGKRAKMPYYVDGTLRRGTLDGPADVARLVGFDAALAALEGGDYAGLGFALGAGGGGWWQWIDLDHTDTGPELAALVDMVPGYLERSPSGTRVHAIGYGAHDPTLAPGASGIEAYAGALYLTVTGGAIGGDIEDLAGYVADTLAPLHGAGRPAPTEARPAPAETVTPARIADLRSALLHVRADDRGLWVRMGHALYGLGDIGRGLWLTWSATSPKFR